MFANTDQADLVSSLSIEPLRCGVDVVSIKRIAGLLDEFGSSFRERVFTPVEEQYCEKQGYPPQHYAARWAAKEAFLKAIDSRTYPVSLKEIGVRHNGEEPVLVLSSRARAAVTTTMCTDDTEQIATGVSLSHDRRADCAAGQVVLFDPKRSKPEDGSGGDIK